jgi:zeaxanthin epoxidase
LYWTLSWLAFFADSTPRTVYYLTLHCCVVMRCPAGFAAIMASTYKAYLGEGLGPLEFIKQFHIPHPGRVIGRAVLHLTMPAVLDWVLGGNNGHLARARPSACRVEDKLKVGRSEARQQYSQQYRLSLVVGAWAVSICRPQSDNTQLW